MSAFDDHVAAVTFDHDDNSVVVIVGSGAGGGTLANELCQKGVNVVLLEAGGRIEMADFENDELAMADRWTWDDRREARGNRANMTMFPDQPAWMLKTVGGTSVHWAGTSIRLKDSELRARTTYGDIAGTTLIDWPLSLEELEPYYDRAEAKLGVAGTGGRPWLPQGNNYKVLALGAKRVGYTDYDTGTHAINSEPYDGRNACDQIGYCFQGCKSGAKWSTLYTDIPRAEATGRCEVRPHSMALRVEHDDAGRASGVLYADKTGNQHVQKARVVSVAGNAIETPRLLLNSASAMFPDGLANNAGQVGKHYITHVDQGIYAIFDKPVNFHRGRVVSGIIRDESHHRPERGFAGGFYFLAVSLGLPGYAGWLYHGAWGRAYAGDIEAYNHTAGCTLLAEDMPSASNRIYLHPDAKDQNGLPIPVCHQDYHANDLVARNHALKKGTELYEAAGARKVIEWKVFPAGHNMGTCRMAEDPRDGVTNRWGQSHEITNLFVSDGSQFSSGGAGNPTLTIVALAIRQAEYIAEQMRRNDL